MSGEVNTETDTHNEVNESNAIKNNAPNRHETKAASEGADNAKDGTDGRDCIGEENNGHCDDNDTGEQNARDTLSKNCEVLISVGEITVEHICLEIFIAYFFANFPDFQHHVFLLFCTVDILSLN